MEGHRSIGTDTGAAGLAASHNTPLTSGAGHRLIRLDPNTIRWSRFYNRAAHSMSEENPEFKQFLTKIEASQGNAVPILVFEIEPDADGHRYETVYGHRRLESCRQLGFEVNAILQDRMTPQEQGRLQLVENEGQSRLSVVERGKQIASQLREGIWPNVGVLAEKIGYTRTHAQHLKAIGEHIPEGLLLAHPEPSAINFRTAQALVRLAKDDMTLLKQRLETLRRDRDNMTGTAATAFLLTGEIIKDQRSRPRAPQAEIKRRRDGLQVTIRGLGTDAPEGFEARLKAFLGENNIELKT